MLTHKIIRGMNTWEINHNLTNEQHRILKQYEKAVKGYYDCKFYLDKGDEQYREEMNKHKKNRADAISQGRAIDFDVVFYTEVR